MGGEKMESVVRRMREEWDARAVEDARYYTTFQWRNQDEKDYARSADEIVARIRRDYGYLPASTVEERRFLEIGCGLGRLMGPLAEDCGEIHGVDISPEMIARGRARLAHVAHAHLAVAQDSDLSLFADESFDLVYSYAVFQHIPERALVFRYLDEAYRVLKAEGLFTAQFYGIARAEERHDTLGGVWTSEEELLRYAREKRWPVISSEGRNTPCFWVTMRKLRFEPAPPLPAVTPTIFAVRHPDGGSELVAGGPRGFAELFVRNLSDAYADLTQLSADLDGQPIPVCYIGPLRPGSWRQVNVQVPDGAPSGSCRLAFCWNGRVISNAFEVVVRSCPAPRPQLIRITDGVEMLREGTINCGLMAVTLRGCRDIGSLRIVVGGAPVGELKVFCMDALAGEYQVWAPAPQGLQGRQTVRIWLEGEELPPYAIEIVNGRSE